MSTEEKNTINVGSLYEAELVESLIEFSYQRGVTAGTLYGFCVCIIAYCTGHLITSIF